VSTGRGSLMAGALLMGLAALAGNPASEATVKPRTKYGEPKQIASPQFNRMSRNKRKALAKKAKKGKNRG
jgi:hypothetical protein